VNVGELRKDYILDEWVIIESARGKRPHDFKTESGPAAVSTDYFGVGNEKLTPPEIGRVPDGKGGWKLRWFENKFAALHLEGQVTPRTDNAFFTFANNVGHHEVIVETPDMRQLWELSVDEVTTLLGVWRERINVIGAMPGISYVNVFKNSGPIGGTSIAHSHTQVMATAMMPPRVRAELDALRKFINDPYERILAIERTGPRFAYENEKAIVICPYASRFNFEAWVFPKRFARTLVDVGELRPLAQALCHVLAKLRELNCSYNIVLHYSPKGEDMRLHFEVMPRIATWAGFELGTGIIINSVPPETAAAFYRGEQ